MRFPGWSPLFLAFFFLAIKSAFLSVSLCFSCYRLEQATATQTPRVKGDSLFAEQHQPTSKQTAAIVAAVLAGTVMTASLIMVICMVNKYFKDYTIHLPWMTALARMEGS